MKVLLAGAGGQLGQELRRSVPDEVKLVALDHKSLDITDEVRVKEVVRAEQPDWIVNAAAYTNVDGAEGNKDDAFAINRDGAGILARAAEKQKARMLHISTDYVFSGRKCDLYKVEDQPDPCSIYGMSKYEGEQAVLSVLGASAVILRSSWIYSCFGNNFVKTMLQLMKSRDEINVVCDQIGTPTWAHNLACVVWRLLFKDAEGVLHWSDSGVASWYDFASCIEYEASRIGLLKSSCCVYPIMTEEYPTAAERPKFCVLDKNDTSSLVGYKPEYWNNALRSMLGELLTSE